MKGKSSPERSRLEPEPVARRDFLGLASVLSAAAALGFGSMGMLRLPRPAVMSSPTKKFKVKLPDSLPLETPFLPPGRPVALYRTGEGVYALSLVCTHLGCIVKPSGKGFECPCHGSFFGEDGIVKKGPAPKPLAWLKVTGSAGSYIVDEGSAVPMGTYWRA
jgi:cytochrome b6-f complex iron-sulfur subunit